MSSDSRRKRAATQLTTKRVILALFLLFGLYAMSSLFSSGQKFQEPINIPASAGMQDGNADMQAILLPALPPVLGATRLARSRNIFGDYANIQLLDKGYVTMTKHWICNVRGFTGVLDATVFLVLDTIAEKALLEFDPNLNVVLLPFTSSVNAELSYGQVAYYEVMELRTNLLLELLKHDVSFMLTESDAYWSSNVLQEIEELNWDTNSFDMISASNTMGSNTIQGGFQLNRASPQSVFIWGELCKTMDIAMTSLRAKYGHGSTQFVAGQGSEQDRMGELVWQLKNTFKIRYLPHSVVASGEWYRQDRWKMQYPHPTVLLNNWIAGNGDKIERAIKEGHFCYDVGKKQCMNPNKVRSLGLLRGGAGN